MKLLTPAPAGSDAGCAKTGGHKAGTRVPIDIILGLLGDGLTPEEIIKQHYPHIAKDDILACIRYARQIVEDEEIYMVKAG
jgi:uncharacterized protein (DUF433 family)